MFFSFLFFKYTSPSTYYNAYTSVQFDRFRYINFNREQQLLTVKSTNNIQMSPRRQMLMIARDELSVHEPFDKSQEELLGKIKQNILIDLSF